MFALHRAFVFSKTKSTIFMDELEQQFLNSDPLSPHIRGTVCMACVHLWFSPMLETFEYVLSSLKFTMEIGGQNINHLDLTILLKENQNVLPQSSIANPESQLNSKISDALPYSPYDVTFGKISEGLKKGFTPSIRETLNKSRVPSLYRGRDTNRHICSGTWTIPSSLLYTWDLEKFRSPFIQESRFKLLLPILVFIR